MSRARGSPRTNCPTALLRVGIFRARSSSVPSTNSTAEGSSSMIDETASRADSRSENAQTPRTRFDGMGAS